jgi:hypothetical protein
MQSRLFYTTARICALCFAAAVGYVVVYIPLMELVWDKGYPPSFPLILAASLAAAAAFARFADLRLPKPAIDSTQESDGN